MTILSCASSRIVLPARPLGRKCQILWPGLLLGRFNSTGAPLLVTIPAQHQVPPRLVEGLKNETECQEPKEFIDIRNTILSDRLRRESRAREALSASLATMERREESANDVLESLRDPNKSGSEAPEEDSTATPKKKRRKKKKKTGEATDLGQGGNTAARKPVITGNGWTGDTWKQDYWGKDELKPKGSDTAETSGRPNPPHLKPKVLQYSRRVEGLLENTEGESLKNLEPPSEHKPIANLAHGLDRVLFNPGVHWLQDPRSRVYNFPPTLRDIPKVVDFGFERLSGFIKSSHDEDLWTLAKQEGRKFGGSTSSLTGILSHIYFLISGDKPVNIRTLSQNFKSEPTSFTSGQRMPTSIVFNYKDGIYTIDSDGKDDATDKNILLWMGTLLEKYLTMPTEEFNKFMRSETPAPEEIEGEGDLMREAYRYAKSEKFVMRSQLDCVDRRLPGTGVFDIKTRACLPIRMDILNFEESSGYLIRSQHGLTESFEREYYDLVRSAFLKYGFQARIGNMDGVFVAYHNTARLFGFQYVPLQEMDERLFGTRPGAGERVFRKCVGLMEVVAGEITECYPEQSVKCTIETLEGSNKMNVWIEPLEWEGDAPKPMAQLVVTAHSFLDDAPARSTKAISSDSPWTLHWTVTRLSGQEETIRTAFNAAKDRQFRAFNLPSGVAIEDIQEFWKGLNFSGKAVVEKEEPTEPDVKFFDNFRVASGSIEALRQLARDGRATSEQQALEEAGRPKIVLGEPDSLSSEELNVIIEESLTHEEPDDNADTSSVGELPVVNMAFDIDAIVDDPASRGTEAPEDADMVELASNFLTGQSVNMVHADAVADLDPDTLSSTLNDSEMSQPGFPQDPGSDTEQGTVTETEFDSPLAEVQNIFNITDLDFSNPDASPLGHQDESQATTDSEVASPVVVEEVGISSTDSSDSFMSSPTERDLNSEPVSSAVNHSDTELSPGGDATPQSLRHEAEAGHLDVVSQPPEPSSPSVQDSVVEHQDEEDTASTSTVEAMDEPSSKK